MSNIIAIVGRPNVGKSTLFNRLTESRKAIVDEQSGVTRDRHYGQVEWNGRTFSVIDTGGFVSGSDDVFEKEINKQVKTAIEESRAVIFLVDVTTGLTDLDLSVAELLRKSRKPVLVAVNKIDNNKLLDDVNEFYKLGLGKLFPVSSMNGSGTGELLDELVSILPEKEETDPELPRFAIIGQPNVGKSSLFNLLLGEERTIVTPVAGTTRDTINTRYTGYGFDFFLVDTAGLRKKANVHEDLEFYSVMRTVRAIEDCDVGLLLIDATQGLNMQDINIFRLLERNNKGVVILVNKWDLVEKENNDADSYTKAIRKKLEPFNDVPVVFTSVLNKQRVHKALKTATEVFQNRSQKISTSVLNKKMLPYIDHYPPPSYKGKSVSIKYITQISGSFPQFAFFCNLPQYIRDPYKRYLENKMREEFKLTGVPVGIYFRKKN